MKKGKVTHGYICQEFWDYKEFLQICNKLSKVSRRKGWWIRLIRENKLICPKTNLKVKYVSLDRLDNKKGSTFHYNFYSECGELFTVDHIIPRSKGGAVNDVNNLQPMIAEYNWEKGNTLETNLQRKDQTNIFGQSLEKTIKPKSVRVFNNLGYRLFVQSFRYGDIPKELIPNTSTETYSDDTNVDLKVVCNWGVDLTDGGVKIIPNGKANSKFMYTNFKDVVDDIKNGGKHSEHILKTFINNYISLQNEQK